MCVGDESTEFIDVETAGGGKIKELQLVECVELRETCLGKPCSGRPRVENDACRRRTPESNKISCNLNL